MDLWKEMEEPHINQYFRLQIIGLTEGFMWWAGDQK